MEILARRNVLKLMLGAGAAAACGLTVPGTAEAKSLTAAADGTVAATGAAEAVEAGLEPNQFIIVRRRRRWRRRIYYVRPRRRVVYVVRRRPRRFYRVVRVRRFRRW